jgi:hypothetical protein
VSLARHAWEAWPHVAITAAAAVLAAQTKVHPALILVGGAALGSLLGGQFGPRG